MTVKSYTPGQLECLSLTSNILPGLKNELIGRNLDSSITAYPIAPTPCLPQILSFDSLTAGWNRFSKAETLEAIVTASPNADGLPASYKYVQQSLKNTSQDWTRTHNCY